MPTDKVRVGIVGSGLIGGIHAAAVNLLPAAVLTAVCDAVPGKAATFAATHAPGARAFDDLAAMLDADAEHSRAICPSNARPFSPAPSTRNLEQYSLEAFLAGALRLDNHL